MSYSAASPYAGSLQLFGIMLSDAWSKRVVKVRVAVQKSASTTS